MRGGSDHSSFLSGRARSAVLVLTDYVYHTTVDTSYMASADELESVGITPLSAGLSRRQPHPVYQRDAEILVDAAADRFASEAKRIRKLTRLGPMPPRAVCDDAYAPEKSGSASRPGNAEYREAIASCTRYFSSSAELAALPSR